MTKEGKPASGFFADKLGPGLPLTGTRFKTPAVLPEKIGDPEPDVHESILMSYRYFSPEDRAQFRRLLPFVQEIARKIFEGYAKPGASLEPSERSFHTLPEKPSERVALLIQILWNREYAPTIKAFNEFRQHRAKNQTFI